jgi:hypothetical protein
MVSTSTRSTPQERVATRKLVWVGPLNPLLLLAGLWLPAPGMNLHIFWTMIVMHIVSALIAASLLTTLAVERAQPIGHVF